MVEEEGVPYLERSFRAGKQYQASTKEHAKSKHTADEVRQQAKKISVRISFTSPS